MERLKPTSLELSNAEPLNGLVGCQWLQYWLDWPNRQHGRPSKTSKRLYLPSKTLISLFYVIEQLVNSVVSITNENRCYISYVSAYYYCVSLFIGCFCFKMIGVM
ncbi:hypothetical protein C9J21_07090 [Photobacterium phosphoreum]|nr:hypothetical protein C9J21_07090 [Photobacterium phosphoreum]